MFLPGRHRSAAGVLADYEPWFPSSVNYRAFDSEGRRLELLAEPPVQHRRLLGLLRTESWDSGSLHLRAIEADASGADELAALPRAWLRVVGAPSGHLESMTLAELLSEATDRQGFTPHRA